MFSGYFFSLRFALSLETQRIILIIISDDVYDEYTPFWNVLVLTFAYNPRV